MDMEEKDGKIYFKPSDGDETKEYPSIGEFLQNEARDGDITWTLNLPCEPSYEWEYLGKGVELEFVDEIVLRHGDDDELIGVIPESNITPVYSSDGTLLYLNLEMTPELNQVLTDLVNAMTPDSTEEDE